MRHAQQHLSAGLVDVDSSIDEGVLGNRYRVEKRGEVGHHVTSVPGALECQRLPAILAFLVGRHRDPDQVVDRSDLATIPSSQVEVSTSDRILGLGDRPIPGLGIVRGSVHPVRHDECRSGIIEFLQDRIVEFRQLPLVEVNLLLAIRPQVDFATRRREQRTPPECQDAIGVIVRIAGVSE